MAGLKGLYDARRLRWGEGEEGEEGEEEMRFDLTCCAVMLVWLARS